MPDHRAWPQPPPPPARLPPPPPPVVAPWIAAPWPAASAPQAAPRRRFDPGRWIALAVMVVIVVGIGLASTVTGPGARPADCGLGSEWTCSAVSVPADHFSGRDEPSIDVTYAVHEAANRGSAPRRVLLLATGGPGASGLDDGVWMLGALSPRITDAFDIVTFDARGVGLSDGRDCPRASRDYNAAPVTPTSASALVNDCIREADADDLDLHRYATVQVVEDIETIRQRLGVDRITLYGSSYGTVVAQAYAAAHPDRLDGLVLDAPIDRALPASRMWAVAAHGFENAVSVTLAWCRRDPDCHAAMPDPSDAYQRLLAELSSAGEIQATVRDPVGNATTMTLSAGQFDTLTDSAMYDPMSRMAWLRALAAYDKGDRGKLVHLYDVWSGPGSSSTFAYYATWCADVRAAPMTSADDFSDYEAALRAEHVTAPSSIDIASSIAPCVFWPAKPGSWTPPAEVTTVPTLILTTTTDPITPESEAQAIAQRLPLARLIETRGGGHGSLGADCPNDRMAEFVVDGQLPVGLTSVCDGAIADPFIPLASSPATDAEEAAIGLIREISAAPEVLTWNGLGTLRVGCADGGRVTLSNTIRGVAADLVSADLHDCAWASAATFTGDGTYDLSTGDADLHLHSARGDIDVVSRGSTVTVSGTWDGRPASAGD